MIICPIKSRFRANPLTISLRGNIEFKIRFHHEKKALKNCNFAFFTSFKLKNFRDFSWEFFGIFLFFHSSWCVRGFFFSNFTLITLCSRTDRARMWVWPTLHARTNLFECRKLSEPNDLWLMPWVFFYLLYFVTMRTRGRIFFCHFKLFYG